MKDVVKLLRPQQWVKNMFVFLPLFFDGKLMDVELLLNGVVVFFAFSFAASSIYCLNDIRDAEADKTHSEKCKRPIASGAVSKAGGYGIMAMSAALSLFILLFYVNGGGAFSCVYVVAGYYVMNLAYCVSLKNKALIDVFIIAVGFVLRVVLGGLATGIYLSHWIIIMTFLLALFLAFAKRRDDVVKYVDTGVKARKNINRYNIDFMNQSITIVATITLVAYVMYTVSPEVMERIGSPYLYATSVFVMLGIMRYLQLTIVDVKSGSPTKVLMRDRFIQCCIVGWIMLFAMIIYM